jgi:hypothetical protein
MILYKLTSVESKFTPPEHHRSAEAFQSIVQVGNQLIADRTRRVKIVVFEMLLFRGHNARGGVSQK